MIPPALLKALTNSCGDLWLGGQKRLVEEAIEQAYVQGFEDADLPAGALLRIQGVQGIDAGSLAPGADYRFTDRLRLESRNWLGLGNELRDATPDNGRRLDLEAGL